MFKLLLTVQLNQVIQFGLGIVGNIYYNSLNKIIGPTIDFKIQTLLLGSSVLPLSLIPGGNFSPFG